MFLRLLILSLVYSAAFCSAAFAEVGLLNRQGSTIDTALQFKDEENKSVSLDSFFHEGRPVLLAPVYFHCRGTCTVTVNNLFDDLERLKLNPGHALEIVIVSIDPKDSFLVASERKKSFLEKYSFKGEGFHFLTGDQSAISHLTSDLGFQFEKSGDEYSHPSVIYALGGRGVIVKNMSRARYSTRELRAIVSEAALGRKLTTFERMSEFCGALLQKF